MCRIVFKHVLFMNAERSTLEIKHFVKEREARYWSWRFESWTNQWWTRQTWTSEFQDYHIPLWNTRKVPAFGNWFRKMRTTKIDMLFKKIYNRINHFILSVQNQNKWFGMLETSNNVQFSRRDRKRSAKYVDHTGTLVSFIARAGTSCIKKEGRISNSSIIRWTNLPNKLQIQFVTDRDDLMTCKMEETRPVLRRSMLILLTKDLVLQTKRGTRSTIKSWAAI